MAKAPLTFEGESFRTSYNLLSFQLLARNFEWRIKFGVPYGSRTRVAAVKEKGPIVIQWNLAAWIALYRTSRTHGNAYWTFNGPPLALGERR
jgi:hypothetical protein